ncbi:MAG: pilus assembly protein [Archangiaceae bacterium]|nr:pilus assembly protein [Archangiaceae bacterium]
MRRGQATVELALVALVFVSVLLFGIHFAELGAMKLRVQQAGVFAAWQATGDRAHQLDRGTAAQSPIFHHANQLRDGSGRTPEEATLRRYHDFEPLTERAGNDVRWAKTRGSRLSVRCDPERVAIPPTTQAIQRLATGYTFARYNNRDVDAVGCNATARVAMFGMPKSLLEDSGGFFKLPFAIRPFVTVCAVGRADRGVCRGQIPFAIDDWGLAGTQGDESGECDFNCSITGSSGNLAYKQTIERLYRRYQTTNSVKGWTIQTFVRELFVPDNPALMTVVPVDERDFRFAFIGDHTNRPFQIRTSELTGPGSGTGFGPNGKTTHWWATTPFSSRYQAGYRSRDDCFAGVPCTRSPFEK